MLESRDYILKTSLSLFLRKGFKEVTMNEIVNSTGLSKGAFYHYFSSKEHVFEEVIFEVFSDLMTGRFSALSADTLKGFYENILQSIEKKRLKSQADLESKAGESFRNNHYYLIFDAMRLLPEFRKQQHNEQKKELKAWRLHVVKAKKSGEIRSEISDELIAKMFIYLSDGLHINLIMGENHHPVKNELKNCWDSLYLSLIK